MAGAMQKSSITDTEHTHTHTRINISAKTSFVCSKILPPQLTVYACVNSYLCTHTYVESPVNYFSEGRT